MHLHHACQVAGESGMTDVFPFLVDPPFHYFKQRGYNEIKEALIYK